MSSDTTTGDGGRLSTLLAATALGAYLLVILGATTAVAEAAATCTAWPVCADAGTALERPEMAVALGHRAAALVVGAMVLASAALALRGSAKRHVRIALVLALALYPVQIGLGALAAASGGATGLLATVHLVFGLSIFGSLILALAWTLEARTATPADHEPVEAPEPPGEVPESPGEVPVSPGEASEPPVVPGDSGSAARSGGRSVPEAASVSGTASLPEPGWERRKAVALAYLRMTKPRLMWLLCLVAVAGMALAAGPALSWRTVGLTLLGGVLAIAASGTFNNVLERDVDRRMERTADRPVASALVPVRNAVVFGAGLTTAAVAAFLAINRLAALLGLVAILYYSVVYTLVLKPNTVQNTVVGGAAGALPALIGWAAVTNEIGLPALALAGVIFLWTPAHFYNLALAYKEDYARGGFPMLPVVRGEATTRKHVLFYLGATLGGAAVLGTVSSLGPLFALTSVVAGGAFLWAAIGLHEERTERAAMRSFHASNAYLGLVLVALVVDALAL